VTRRVTGTGRAALCGVVALVVLAFLIPVAKGQGPRVLLAEIDGPIDRATVDYVVEAIEEARAGGYAALMFRFDTDGGGLDETIQIAQIFNSAADVPILGWVGPVGARAWSAGTILLVATDLAAMDPATTIGSVQPVIIGPGGFETVTDPKIVNAVVNLTRRQLEIHGRNEALADEFVIHNLNLNGREALSRGAIEIVAASPRLFLDQADGRRVVVQSGSTVYKDLTLVVAGAEIVTFTPSLRVLFLAFLTDPLIASLLLILGIYLLVAGLTAPGHGAEIGGIVVLLLALIGLGFSVDPIALLLMVLGVILLVVELKTPGFGAFGIGGIVMIVLAAVFLARNPRFVATPEYLLFFLIALVTPAAAFGGFLLFALYKVMEVRRRKPAVGTIIGESVRVVDPVGPEAKGYVLYHGELWQATAEEPMARDEAGYIHAVDGIVLRVSRSPPAAPVTTPLWRQGVNSIRQIVNSIRRRVRLSGPPNP
jgi:membrane-bound serine protease (ClpP class)